MKVKVKAKVNIKVKIKVNNKVRVKVNLETKIKGGQKVLLPRLMPRSNKK